MTKGKYQLALLYSYIFKWQLVVSQKRKLMKL